AALFFVNACHRGSHILQTGTGGIGGGVNGGEAFGLGHSLEKGSEKLGGAVLLNQRSCEDIDACEHQGEDQEYCHGGENGFQRIFHLFTPPRGFLAVQVSTRGLRMFINRMEKDTPSG